MSQNRAILPQQGVSFDDIKADLRQTMIDDVRGHWSRSFRAPKDVQEVGSYAYNLFLSDNGLFSMRTEYLRRIEEDVISMCTGLFNGPADSSGTFTSGGSESIYSALHAMREWAKVHRPNAHAPEVVAPYSAHPSFSKGCHYFGLKLVRTELGPDLKASPDAMRAAITDNTIGMVGSAPCWPYGNYDPIADLAAIAKDAGIWMHVDACVGGYLAPFMEKLGRPLPAWDFRLPGVMSISADLHKLGYCLKPASTIMWRSEDLKQYHYVHPDDWPGGQYSMTGFAGSRSAGPIFAAWAIMRYLGEAGYMRLAEDLMLKKAKLLQGIGSIEGLEPWYNDLLPVCFGATDVDLGAVKGEMGKLGWILVACARPPLINIPLDAATDDRVLDCFLDDLHAITRRVRSSGGQAREELRY